MASLLDLGKMSKTVMVTAANGEQLELPINAISAEVIFDLLWRFETFRVMMEGKVEQLTPTDIMGKMAPDALAAVLVACTGGTPDPDDERIKAEGGDFAKAKAKLRAEAEGIARNMGMDDQLTIISEAFKITFREGVGPFVMRLRSLLTSADVKTLEQAMNSPEELSASLSMDVHSPKSGKNPPGKYSPGLNS